MIIFKQNRIFITISIILILVALGYYDYINNGELYRLELRKSKYWNLSGLEVRKIEENYFYAESRNDSIYGFNYLDKLPKDEELRIGDLIQLKSTVIGKDSLDINFIHISRTRPAKIWLSVIPVLILFYMFFKYFRFDKKRKIFMEK